jgi:hypothetical protein
MEDLRKKFPYFFLVMISLILIFIYVCFVKLLVLDLHPFPDVFTVIFIVFYHLVIVLLVWSIVEAIRRDPGKVPIQWVVG